MANLDVSYAWCQDPSFLGVVDGNLSEIDRDTLQKYQIRVGDLIERKFAVDVHGG